MTRSNDSYIDILLRPSQALKSKGKIRLNSCMANNFDPTESSRLYHIIYHRSWHDRLRRKGIAYKRFPANTHPSIFCRWSDAVKYHFYNRKCTVVERTIINFKSLVAAIKYWILHVRCNTPSWIEQRFTLRN